MASAGSPPRKRKLSRDEREVRSRKEESNRPQSSRRRSKKEGRGESLQVRSVSELAKLVTSGRIRVPKSLVHYVDDRAQLLDQIFTILSPSDVKGMLPDILKGLRMKQVKRLCYDKLKSMDTDEVRKTIQPPVSEWDGEVDATLMDLLEYKAPSQTTPDPREGKEQQPVDHIPESSSPPKAASESGMIQISDVSGDEGSMETSTQKVDQARSSPTVPSCGTNRTEERCATVDSDCGQEEEVLSDSSATEECWDGGYAVNVPEAAHLLEMELRRRALESELKRTNSQQMQLGDDKALERTGLQQKQISENVDRGTEEDVSSEVGSAVGGCVGLGGTVNEDGRVLELKLRERALQSMLARRERSSL